mgnify:CR=1 FL=1
MELLLPLWQEKHLNMRKFDSATKARPIFPIIQQMSDNGDLMNLNLGLYDYNEEVLEHLKRFE